MQVKLHRSATTTPRIRREIQQSKDSIAVLARRYGVTEPTIRTWKHRDFVEDVSHTAHRLQTTLTAAQEVVVVELLKLLLLSLDDLLVVTREFICGTRRIALTCLWGLIELLRGFMWT